MNNLRTSACFGAVMALAAATASAATDRFGVVGLTEREHLLCTTWPVEAKQGDRVAIFLLPSEEVIDARVGSPIEECGFGQEPGGHAYRLELARPHEEVHGSVAVLGQLPPGVTYRQCAGSESLHLTAWQNGRRIWHGYYYLGYDVEPDCRRDEVE
jgi:hypothetical protein